MGGEDPGRTRTSVLDLGSRCQRATQAEKCTGHMGLGRGHSWAEAMLQEVGRTLDLEPQGWGRLSPGPWEP